MFQVLLVIKIYIIFHPGIGLILEDVGYENRKSIRQQLEDVFQRDWASRYAYSIDKTVSDVKILKNSLNEAENRTNYTR